MSENVTISGGGGTATIYGTLAEAKAYISTKSGSTYKAWRDLPGDDDERKRTLATAAEYLDSQVWQDAYDTFAERDALIEFQKASYELAVMILADDTLVAAADQGSNVRSVKAGGTGVEYFNSTTRTATRLPPILMRFVGSYLSAPTNSSLDGGSSQAGSCVNPFSDCADYDRKKPY